MDLGIGELIVIFLVVMLLFGANKLPGLGEGLGKALRSFKDAMAGKDEEAPGQHQGPPAGGGSEGGKAP